MSLICVQSYMWQKVHMSHIDLLTTQHNTTIHLYSTTSNINIRSWALFLLLKVSTKHAGNSFHLAENIEFSLPKITFEYCVTLRSMINITHHNINFKVVVIFNDFQLMINDAIFLVFDP